MGTTKTFEVIAVVGASGADRATIRVHADEAHLAGVQAGKILTGFRRVWETRELLTPRATGDDGEVSLVSETGSIVWRGRSDTTAPAGHRGAEAIVDVDADGDVRVDLPVPGLGGATVAPMDWEEEAHALRAAVRAMAAKVGQIQEEHRTMRKAIERALEVLADSDSPAAGAAAVGLAQAVS